MIAAILAGRDNPIDATSFGKTMDTCTAKQRCSDERERERLEVDRLQHDKPS
jgi:hypothetical protein